MKIEEIKKLLPRVIEHRRELHKIPELGLDLPKTIEYVERHLKDLGLSPKRVGKGITCDIGNPPFVAIRADMDALPMEEKNDLPYKSTHPGKMHACGHDAHTAVLLGLAEYFSKNSPQVGVRLIFQAGEEGYFGAVEMIKAGALENVELILGQHVGNQAEAPEGGIITKKGVFMASADAFDVKFKGKGGHGSAPHEARDPIAPAAQFVTSVYSFRSREINQTHPFVTTITKLVSGTTFNVIPDIAEIAGTVRTISEEDRKKAARRLEEMAKGVAEANDIEFEFVYHWMYRTLVNTDWVVDMLVEVVSKMGIPIVQLDTPIMGGEDFSYYLEKVPGVFFFTNTANLEKGIVQPNHSPYFNIDEEKLWVPMAVFVKMVEEYASKK